MTEEDKQLIQKLREMVNSHSRTINNLKARLKDLEQMILSDNLGEVSEITGTIEIKDVMKVFCYRSHRYLLWH